MFLHHAPAQKFQRLIFAAFNIKALRESVLDLIGIRKGSVGIESDEAFEIVDPRNITVGHFRLDGVLVLSFGLRAVEIFFQSGRTQLECKFAVVAGNGFSAEVSGGIEGSAVTCGAHRAGRGDTEPRTEMQRYGYFGRNLRTLDNG